MTNLLLRLFVKDYKNIKDPIVRTKYGLLGSFFGLLTNLLIFIIKIVFGLITSTVSIIADSLNNLSDFGNNFISILGFKFSSKKADNTHPFGHQRLEHIISLILGIIIVELGSFLLYKGIVGIIDFSKSIIETGKPVIISNLSLVMFIVTSSLLLISIIVKLAQSYLYFSLAKRINSMQLKVLGKDSRNDIIATSAVLISLFISYFTTYDIDCFFTIAVSIFVIFSGINIIKEAIEVLLGKKIDEETIKKISNIVTSHKEVLGVHDLLVHSYGDNKYGTIDIEISDSLSLNEAHDISDNIEKELLNETNISFSIHIDPIKVDSSYQKLKKEISSLLKKINNQISLHDLHLNKEKEIISFDIIIPSEIDSFESKKDIQENINKMLSTSSYSKYKLNITFDNLNSTFIK